MVFTSVPFQIITGLRIAPADAKMIIYKKESFCQEIQDLIKFERICMYEGESLSDVLISYIVLSEIGEKLKKTE